MRIDHRLIVLSLLAVTAGCNSRNPHLAEDARAAVALSGGPNTSMTYVARTDSGVIAIDLGWWGHQGPTSRALKSLGASEADVKRVFITHSHRDHIAGWPEVRHARFHMAAAEWPRMTGTAAHRGWMVRAGEWLNATNFPDSAELKTETFTRDTAFVFGEDSLRAYLVPGHTAGSAVYLFRGVLFTGDAVTYIPFRGYRPAKAQFTDDSREAIENLSKLWSRLPLKTVRVICTAHGECAPFTPEIVRSLGGDWRP